VASETTGFTTFFGFAPQYTSGAASINGDDAIELFMSGGVVDVFGDVNTDGSGEPWEYLDGWAYRNDATGPDGTTFVFANWTFSGPNALDGESSNGTAATPFPIGVYSSCTPSVPVPDLLLSEVLVTPTAGEFVEIYNPTGAAIDLSDVYLTDATFAGGGTYYYNIVTGANAGGGGFGDFHARFPDGATIAPGEFQTVSMAGSDDYFATYGFDPTYELYEDGAADGVADMREALPGSINNQGGLTNGGEIVVLYTWDGASDLVADIDYAVWGDKDEAVDKTGAFADGPDADVIPSDYLADTSIGSQDVVSGGSHASGDSFQRVDFDEGVETQIGGNGITGSDETSEDLSNTWQLLAATPGATPPAPPSDWVINEIHADPASGAAGDANGDGVRDGVDDEFVEIVNTSGGNADISGWTLSDGFGLRHTFPAGSVVADGCSIVIFGGGVPTGAFGISQVQTASGGSLGLNNGGDDITLNNGVSDVATVSYGSAGGDNQSLTLDPDVTGAAFVKHSVAAGSGGALYSPGTQIDGTQFSGCPSAWVINELHADPASGDAGDANSDGVRHFGDDEFVEIVNNTGGDVDISGWTLADGFSVRHTFPADTVVFDGCSVVVFGGGSPTGAFGNSLVQTASTGSVGLNNGGDDITLNDGVNNVTMINYGGEGGDNQSLTLDPDVSGAPPRVKHASASGSDGSLFSPGTKIDGSQFDGCPVAANVYEIQGSGASSPLDGKLVETTGVVTAVGPDGFFMQMSDGDPDTSDGIFVFTGGPPAVAVGDVVDVTGVVDEFFGFTEISFGADITVVGTETVPEPVEFGANVPSPDPDAPSCALEFECYEGMLVTIADGTITGPNQRFGVDPIAEVHITAAPSRTFREPGIEFPGINMPPIPTWDGNPEVFELDPDKLGLPNQIIPAGSSFSATGVLGFEFGGYELWPSELTVTPAPLPVSVRAREPGELTVGTLNLFRLFDDVDDPADGDRNDFVVSMEEYERRLAKFSVYIRTVLNSPDILAAQEVESLTVLEDLAAKIVFDDPAVSYTAYLEEGNDIGTIDVGFLVRDNITVDTIMQVDPAATFINPITQEINILHDRPPLLIEGSSELAFGTFPIAVMAVHNRSLSGIDGSEGERVRVKRLLQAESIATKVQDLQTADANVRLVVTGDFNAFEFTDGHVDSLGVIAGNFNPLTSLVCHETTCPGDIVEPNLDNQVLWLLDGDRYSFIFRGNAQALDHALTSQKLAGEISGVEYGRGNADAAVDLINFDGVLRSSDHDGMVVFVAKDKDADGVPNDDDVCPNTTLPENVPTDRLGTNHFADTNGDGVFDTVEPNGTGPRKLFDIGDTAGCSCEQIIEEQGLGIGHTKFGCSIDAMESWISLVNP
jgi:predicted extracellular nuclease